MTFGRVTSQTARDLQFFWKKKKSTKVNTADAVNQEDSWSRADVLGKLKTGQQVSRTEVQNLGSKG